MSVKKGLIVCAALLLCLSSAFSASADPIQESRAEFMTIELNQIEELGVNHEQGSIGFVVDGVHYFYYIHSGDNAQRMIATSSVLNDLRSCTRIKIRHEPYGLHQKITNLLIVFGRTGK